MSAHGPDPNLGVIEKLCERIASAEWPFVEDVRLACDLLPLMLDVVKDAKDISGLALRGIEPLDTHLLAVEVYIAERAA